MTKFHIQTADCTLRSYQFEADTDDLDAAVAAFWDMSNEDRQKAFIAEDWTGEEMDFITIMGPTQ